VSNLIRLSRDVSGSWADNLRDYESKGPASGLGQWVVTIVPVDGASHPLASSPAWSRHRKKGRPAQLPWEGNDSQDQLTRVFLSNDSGELYEGKVFGSCSHEESGPMSAQEISKQMVDVLWRTAGKQGEGAMVKPGCDFAIRLEHQCKACGQHELCADLPNPRMLHKGLHRSREVQQNVAALLIQAVYRGHLAYSYAKIRRKYYTKIAIRIQRAWRAYLFRIAFKTTVAVLMDDRIQHLNLEATKLQRAFRGCRGRKIYYKEWSKKDKAARTIQGRFRLFTSRKHLRGVFGVFSCSAVTLQSWWRMVAVRQYYCYRRQWRIVAAQMLQTALRAAAARRRVQMRRMKYTEACCCIQRKFRWFKSPQSKIVWCYKIMKAATLLIQSAWRRHRFRVLVCQKLHQRWVQYVQLQAWVRMLQARKRFRSTRVVRKLRICFRWVCCAMRIRLAPVRRMRAIVWTQRQIKAKIWGQRVGALKQQAHSELLILQRWVRGHLARVRAKIKKKLLKRIQRVTRGRMARNRVRLIRKAAEKQLAADCEAQEEVVRLLSVYTNRLIENVRIVELFKKYKCDLRYSYILCSIQGTLDVEKLFLISKAQLRTLTSAMKNVHGEALMDKIPDRNTMDYHLNYAAQISEKPFTHFLSGKEIQLAAPPSGRVDYDGYVDLLLRLSEVIYPGDSSRHNRLAKMFRDFVVPYIVAMTTESRKEINEFLEVANQNEEVRKVVQSKKLSAVYNKVAGSNKAVSATTFLELMAKGRKAGDLSSTVVLHTYVAVMESDLYQAFTTSAKFLRPAINMTLEDFQLAISICGMLKYKNEKKAKAAHDKVEQIVNDVAIAAK